MTIISILPKTYKRLEDKAIKIGRTTESMDSIINRLLVASERLDELETKENNNNRSKIKKL